MKKRYTANRSRLLQQQKAYNQTEDAKKKRRISAKARGTTPWQKLKEKFAKHLLNFVINGFDSPLNQATMGCTYAEIRAHIESQFKDGMAWDNYGDVWEFDHIVPYKAFPTVEELDKHHKIVCWYKNVRPLPPPDNRSDGGNYKEEDKQVVLNEDRAKYWLSVGAQPSERVHSLLRQRGLVSTQFRHDSKQKAAPAEAAAEA